MRYVHVPEIVDALEITTAGGSAQGRWQHSNHKESELHRLLYLAPGYDHLSKSTVLSFMVAPEDWMIFQSCS